MSAESYLDMTLSMGPIFIWMYYHCCNLHTKSRPPNSPSFSASNSGWCCSTTHFWENFAKHKDMLTWNAWIIISYKPFYLLLLGKLKTFLMAACLRRFSPLLPGCSFLIHWSRMWCRRDMCLLPGSRFLIYCRQLHGWSGMMIPSAPAFVAAVDFKEMCRIRFMISY